MSLAWPRTAIRQHAHAGDKPLRVYVRGILCVWGKARAAFVVSVIFWPKLVAKRWGGLISGVECFSIFISADDSLARYLVLHTLVPKRVRRAIFLILGSNGIRGE